MKHNLYDREWGVFSLQCLVEQFWSLNNLPQLLQAFPNAKHSSFLSGWARPQHLQSLVKPGLDGFALPLLTYFTTLTEPALSPVYILPVQMWSLLSFTYQYTDEYSPVVW